MCGCEKNIKNFENGGNIDEKCIKLYDIVDLDGSIIEKDLTEEDLINWANTYDWYDLMDVSEDFPVGQIDNVEDAIIAIQGVDNEGDYTVVKKDLVDSEFENGGVIESFRRFTNSDFTRLTDDNFEGRWSGYVWVIKHNDSSKVLGKFNPKKNTLFILGKKDLTNPLVKWLQENSHVSSDEYNRLENGGKINKNWIADALSGGKNKGALRRTALRKGLLRNEDEKLSMTDLHKLEKVGGKTARRAYLAETLRKFDNGGGVEDKFILFGDAEEDDVHNYAILKKEKFRKEINNIFKEFIPFIFDEKYKEKRFSIEGVLIKYKEGIENYYIGDSIDDIDEVEAIYIFNDKNINSLTKLYKVYPNNIFFKEGGLIVTSDWGNDGSTPSNNEDYNKLYALFPDNHAEAKAIWNQLTDKQKSDFINDLEVTDAASEHIAESWLEFINSSSQDDYWENATNWDEMKNGGEVGGRGWGKFKKGEKISSLKDVKVGELYLDHSNLFNSNNIILITSGDTTGLNRDIVYASFVRPNNLKGREETFAIWGHDLEGKIDLYKIKGRKYEFGGNVDLEVYPDEDLRYTNRTIKKSKETLVRENIYNGEIQEYILKTIIGKQPEYPYQIVGSLKLTKCFLRPYYKI
jgi:hypothetical protein